TLNAMLDRVEAAVTRERRVVSDASHELRTPLTTLRAEVDLALLGDRDRAEQTLDNLISNALRYGDGTITLSAREDGELVELHVADEGPGFPDELLGRAFERFARGAGTGG